MQRSDTNRILAARLLSGHTIEMQFDDGYIGQIDLVHVLWGPVFEPLIDLDFFCRFRLEDDTIRWPNDADFCPDVLRYWCESGGVRSQEETDIYFANESAPNT